MCSDLQVSSEDAAEVWDRFREAEERHGRGENDWIQTALRSDSLPAVSRNNLVYVETFSTEQSQIIN